MKWAPLCLLPSLPTFSNSQPCCREKPSIAVMRLFQMCPYLCRVRNRGSAALSSPPRNGWRSRRHPVLAAAASCPGPGCPPPPDALDAPAPTGKKCAATACRLGQPACGENSLLTGGTRRLRGAAEKFKERLGGRGQLIIAFADNHKVALSPGLCKRYDPDVQSIPV